MKYQFNCQTNNQKRTSSKPAIDEIIENREDQRSVQDSFLALHDLKEEEKVLLTEITRLKRILDQIQLKCLRITQDKNRLETEQEKNPSKRNGMNVNNFMLFLVETWGDSWADGLVFTVMADNDTWAKEIVQQWLNSNGRENHKIDKVQALVSQNIRAVVNVGAKLLDV